VTLTSTTSYLWPTRVKGEEDLSPGTFNKQGKPQPVRLQMGPPAVVCDAGVSSWCDVTVNDAYVLMGGGHRELLMATDETFREATGASDSQDNFFAHTWPSDMKARRSHRKYVTEEQQPTGANKQDTSTKSGTSDLEVRCDCVHWPAFGDIDRLDSGPIPLLACYCRECGSLVVGGIFSIKWERVILPLAAHDYVYVTSLGFLRQLGVAHSPRGIEDCRYFFYCLVVWTFAERLDCWAEGLKLDFFQPGGANKAGHGALRGDGAVFTLRAMSGVPPLRLNLRSPRCKELSAVVHGLLDGRRDALWRLAID
jgi:hypothetical protein